RNTKRRRERRTPKLHRRPGILLDWGRRGRANARRRPAPGRRGGAGHEAGAGLRGGADAGLRPPRPAPARPARGRGPRPGRAALAVGRRLLRGGPRPGRLRAPAPDARRLAEGVPPHPEAGRGAQAAGADLREPLAPDRPDPRARLPPLELRLLHRGPGAVPEGRALLLRLPLPPRPP